MRISGIIDSPIISTQTKEQYIGMGNGCYCCCRSSGRHPASLCGPLMTSNWSPQFLQYIDHIDEKDICTKHKINHLASRLNNHRWSLPAISIPFIMMAPSTALSFFTLQLHRPSLPHSPLYVWALISLSHAQEFSSA